MLLAAILSGCAAHRLPLAKWQLLNGSRAQTQDPRCSRCNMRADSANDVRNRLVAGWTWRIPFGSQLKGVAGAVVSGWDIGGILTEQVGNPMFITENVHHRKRRSAECRRK
jgi:hypothetical protein